MERWKQWSLAAPLVVILCIAAFIAYSFSRTDHVCRCGAFTYTVDIEGDVLGMLPEACALAPTVLMSRLDISQETCCQAQHRHALVTRYFPLVGNTRGIGSVIESDSGTGAFSNNLLQFCPRETVLRVCTADPLCAKELPVDGAQLEIGDVLVIANRYALYEDEKGNYVLIGAGKII